MKLLKTLVCFLLPTILLACKTQHDGALSASGLNAYAPLTSSVPGVAYFTLTNRGTRAVTVQGFTSSCFAQAELHSSALDDGVMRMRPVKQLRIEPASSVTLRPGGLHLMLLNAIDNLEPGASCQITVVYEADQKIELNTVLLDRAQYRPAEPVK